MATLLNPFIRAMDANGDPVSGGKLAVFLAGTSTAVTTYSDRALTSAQAQPLIANSAGEFAQSFVAAGIYKIRVRDAGDNTLYENDNVRIADRPDDPTPFDDEAAVLADTATYTTGTYIRTTLEGYTFEAAASGATDHDETNAGGQKLYRKWQPYDTPTTLIASEESARGEDAQWLTRDGYNYKEAASGASDHHVTTAGGVKLYVVPNPDGTINLEQFGEVGSGSNDNALLTAAVGMGKPIVCKGAEYQFDNIQITDAADITFGPSTVVRNTQSSGASQPAIRFVGTGLTGSAISVTAINGSSGAFDPTDELVDTITVSDATSFAVGDTVRLFEDEAEEMETGVSAPSSQDFNNWDFRTILSISGSDIQFEEYIRLPFDTARSLTLQKVVFLENARLQGGIHVGGADSGGGVSMEHCRRSSISHVVGKGNSASDQSAGDPVKFEDCWQCDADNIQGQWTQFGFRSRYSQSCDFRHLKAKRTTNGGVMSVGDKFCNIGPIVNDSAGDDNGDGLGVHSGSKFCTYGPITLTGDHCYGMWIKQPSTDNVFLPIVSTAGVTTCVLNTGNRNTFQSVTVKGNNGSGVIAEADDCTVLHLDYKGPASGFRVKSGFGGAYVRGRSVSTGSDSFAYDLVIGDVTNCDIDVSGGARGIQYASGDRNETNDIVLRGPNPITYGRRYQGRGWTWGAEVLSVSSTAQTLMIPGVAGDTDGLTELVPPSGDEGVSYLITLQARINVTTANSQYQLLGRQDTWYLSEVRKGASSFAPALQVNGSEEIEILSATASAVPVYASITKF